MQALDFSSQAEKDAAKVLGVKVWGITLQRIQFLRKVHSFCLGQDEESKDYNTSKLGVRETKLKVSLISHHHCFSKECCLCGLEYLNLRNVR